MDMISESLQEMIREWTEQLIGVPTLRLWADIRYLFFTPDREPRRSHPLVIIRCGDGSVLVATAGALRRRPSHHAQPPRRPRVLAVRDLRAGAGHPTVGHHHLGSQVSTSLATATP